MSRARRVPGTDPRAAPAWQAVLAMTAAELRLALRRGETLVATAVLPIDHLPDPLAALAGALPAAALSEAFRVALGVGGDATGALILLAGWGLGATGLAVITFRWE